MPFSWLILTKIDFLECALLFQQVSLMEPHLDKLSEHLSEVQNNFWINDDIQM